MKRKLLAGACTILALTMALAAPASAIAILTGDSFSNTGKTVNWVTDRYAPEEFDNSGGKLYLTVGKKGYTKNRPADKQDKYYAIQGKKLELKKPSTDTWTAVIKIDLDDWFSTSQNRRAEFRIDLKDSKGKILSGSPTIAVVKNGASEPTISFYNGNDKTGWAKATEFVNGEKEKESFYTEEGLHSLVIRAKDGKITYCFDEKAVGTYKLPDAKAYPAYAALGAYNYNRTDTVCWDSFYLYDGSYGVPTRINSDKAEDRRDAQLSKTYARKRANWIKDHTYYYSDILQDWVKQSKLPAEEKDDLEALRSRCNDEMPDSYWDY